MDLNLQTPVKLLPLVAFAAFLGCSDADDDGYWRVLEHSSPIVGGHNTSGWEPVVFLDISGWMCTGTLISPDVVLTASHCLEGAHGNLTVKACNSCYWPDDSWWTSTTNDYHEHPQYNASMTHDIGVIVLRENAPFDPIPINREAASGSWLNNANPLTFVGFGVTDIHYNDEGEKREVEIVIDDWDSNYLIHEDHQHNTCVGDSGGPSLTDHSGGWRVASVVSWGDANCEYDGYNTRVDTHASWIDGYTGGWMPTDDDDDDDDTPPPDDDDDDTPPGDDDDTEVPPLDTLPEPRINDEYDLPQGCGCGVGTRTEATTVGGVLILLSLLGFRRRF